MDKDDSRPETSNVAFENFLHKFQKDNKENNQIQKSYWNSNKTTTDVLTAIPSTSSTDNMSTPLFSKSNVFPAHNQCDSTIDQKNTKCELELRLSPETPKTYQSGSKSDHNETKTDLGDFSQKPPETSPNTSDNLEKMGDGDSNDSSKSDLDSSSSNTSRDMENSNGRRLRRNAKRKLLQSEELCPICSITLRNQEIDAHLTIEIEKLSKIPKNTKKPRSESIKTPNQSFQQVKTNREGRLTAKVAKYKAKSKNEIQCPVCNLKMSGTLEEVNKHVLQCLKNNDNPDSDDDELIVDDDDDEMYEEYEFADQTRIRPISLVPGGYKVLNGGSSVNNNTNEDDDELLNVDGDETLAYGKPQYTELDVIPNTINEYEAEERKNIMTVLFQNSDAQKNILDDRKWEVNEKGKKQMVKQKDVEKEKSDQVVASLREKIKDLEENNHKNVKCLICLEPYTKPVVSTTCWHVYCEECWLMTMGVKKLCPQCNMIVFPTDLRRIFL